MPPPPQSFSWFISKIDRSKKAHRYLRVGLFVSKLRPALALLWLTTAIVKTLSIDQFINAIGAVVSLPTPYNEIGAYTLIGMEWLAAIGLLFQRLFTIAALLSCVLASAFAAVNLIRIVEGLTVPCGCFGELLTLNPWTALLLNAVIFIIGLTISGRPALTEDTNA